MYASCLYGEISSQIRFYFYQRVRKTDPALLGIECARMVLIQIIRKGSNLTQ